MKCDRLIWKCWKAYWRVKWWLTEPKPVIYHSRATLADVAADWTWRWEWADKWRGITFNAGTAEKPEWVMMR